MGHVALKVVAKEDVAREVGVVVVVVLLVAAPKVVMCAAPVELGRERYQVQRLSSIDDRVGQSEIRTQSACLLRIRRNAYDIRTRRFECHMGRRSS